MKRFWFWEARDGAVVRVLASQQCGQGSNPGLDAICGLSLGAFFGKIQSRISESKKGFCVFLAKSKNGS